MLRSSSKNLHNQSMSLVQSQKDSASLSDSLPKSSHGFELLPGSSCESSSSTEEQLGASADDLLSRSEERGDSGDFIDLDLNFTTGVYQPCPSCQDERESPDRVTSAERLGSVSRSNLNPTHHDSVAVAAAAAAAAAAPVVVVDSCLKSDFKEVFAPMDVPISEVSALNKSNFKSKTMYAHDSRQSTQSLTESVVSRRSKFTPSADPAALRARQRSLEVIPNFNSRFPHSPSDSLAKNATSASIRAPSTNPRTVRASTDDSSKDQGPVDKYGTFLVEHSSPKLSDSTSRPKKPKSISSSRAEELPFPGFEAKALYFFNQNTWPRKYCLMAVTWPYPFC